MDEVERLSSAALWYAWGRIDGGEFPGMDSDAAFAFRDWYGTLARAYSAHEVGSRPAIQWEWVRFATAGRVLVGKAA